MVVVKEEEEEGLWYETVLFVLFGLFGLVLWVGKCITAFWKIVCGFLFMRYGIQRRWKPSTVIWPQGVGCAFPKQSFSRLQ